MVLSQSLPVINVVTGLCDRTPIDDAFTLVEYGINDFIHECHVRKKQRQQYLTNTQYESLPHAAMLGSKGCVELQTNTSAPGSRPHLSLVQLTKPLAISACALTKFVPLTLYILEGHPRLETKYMKLFMKESASKLLRTSMWMARELKYVNIPAPSLDLPSTDLN